MIDISKTNSLINSGLNLQCVFNLTKVPQQILSTLASQIENFQQYRQLILIGHGGKTLWEQVQRANIKSNDPIDHFSTQVLEQFFATEHPRNTYKIIYPGAPLVPLQELGQMAGWHHPSPLRIGINQDWGLWYAYRLLVLTDTDFEATEIKTSPSPCDTCEQKPCISTCRGKALDTGKLEFERCMHYRLQEDSACANTCIARTRCPVKKEHQYTQEQINYHYARSLHTLRKYQNT